METISSGARRALDQKLRFTPKITVFYDTFTPIGPLARERRRTLAGRRGGTAAEKRNQFPVEKEAQINKMLVDKSPFFPSHPFCVGGLDSCQRFLLLPLLNGRGCFSAPTFVARLEQRGEGEVRIHNPPTDFEGSL